MKIKERQVGRIQQIEDMLSESKKFGDKEGVKTKPIMYAQIQNYSRQIEELKSKVESGEISYEEAKAAKKAEEEALAAIAAALAEAKTAKEAKAKSEAECGACGSIIPLNSDSCPVCGVISARRTYDE